MEKAAERALEARQRFVCSGLVLGLALGVGGSPPRRARGPRSNPNPNPNPNPSPSPNPSPHQVSAARDREAALEAKQAELQREAEAARSVAALKETQGELIHELDKLRAGEM